MVAVAITRQDLDAVGLRRAARNAWSFDAGRRMLALALLLEGKSRAEAARAAGMDRQTLRDWVHRYNEQGVAGLANRPPPGRPARLSAEQKAQVAEWVRRGPDVKTDAVVRWRRVDLSAKILREFKVHLADRSVGTLLRRLGFRRLSVRPQHPEQDSQALEAHKKTSPNW